MPVVNSVIRLALIGANGMLAQKVRERAPGNFEVQGFDLPGFDVTQPEGIRQTLGAFGPDVVVNCAAYTAVDGCEEHADTARMVNGTAAGYLADYCKEHGCILVHVSTDYVFDGKTSRPYRETDAPAPLSQYGASKLAGEQAILASGLRRYLILRTSWLYGPGGNNFVRTILRLAAEREELGIVADQFGSPTYTGDLAEAMFTLLDMCLRQQETAAPYGLYHVSNSEHCSWHEFATAIVEDARALGAELRSRSVRPIATEDYPLPARRPAFSVLDTAKYRETTGRNLPHWRDGLKRYLREINLAQAIQA